jgi:uncharacterized protein YkwD
MLVVALLPLGIVLVMLAFGFLREKWWGVPLALISLYLAYQCFAGCFLVVNAKVLDDVNFQRQEMGVSTLREDLRLDFSARKKACDLRDREYWSHKDPDGRYSWYMFLEQGYDYQYAGENLSRNYSEFEVVEAFMNSPAHKEIMLSPKFEDVGVGVCGEFTVVHFGKEF